MLLARTAILGALCFLALAGPAWALALDETGLTASLDRERQRIAGHPFLAGTTIPKSEQCFLLRIDGSPDAPIDYARIAWGDGRYTYPGVELNENGQSETEVCHDYWSQLGEYYLCFIVHDTAGRLHDECTYVSWIYPEPYDLEWP